MKCKFRTKDDLCTGKYRGFSCIQKQCTYFLEALKCEYHESSGDYCRKYGRFGCVGKDACGTLADYLESVVCEADS